jgi:hypothetical protein
MIKGLAAFYLMPLYTSYLTTAAKSISFRIPAEFLSPSVGVNFHWKLNHNKMFPYYIYCFHIENIIKIKTHRICFFKVPLENYSY